MLGLLVRATTKTSTHPKRCRATALQNGPTEAGRFWPREGCRLLSPSPCVPRAHGGQNPREPSSPFCPPLAALRRQFAVAVLANKGPGQRASVRVCSPLGIFGRAD